MKITRIMAAVMAVMIAAAMMSGCGKKEEAVQTKEPNVVPKATEQKAEETDGESGRPAKQYDVVLDERNDDEKYRFSIEDISFVDTVTGKSLSVGMSMEDVEAIAGTPFTDDKNYRVYDGLIVQFSDEGKVVSMIVSGGMFPNAEQATRYMSSRGVGINTSFDDFSKAYGDIYNKSTGDTDADNAIRYFRVDGDKVEYIGEELSQEDKAKAEKDKNVYIQYFLFSDDNTVSAMRVSRFDYIGQ